jgi:hypothetical protein
MNRKILKENFSTENEEKLRLVEEVIMLRAQLALYTATPTLEDSSAEGLIKKEVEESPSGLSPQNNTILSDDTGATEPPQSRRAVILLSPVIEVSYDDIVVEPVVGEEEREVTVVVCDDAAQSVACDNSLEIANLPPVNVGDNYETENGIVEPRVDESVDAEMRQGIEIGIQTELKMTVKNTLGEELSLQEAEALIEAQHGEILALSKELKNVNPENRHRELILSPSVQAGCCFGGLFRSSSKRSSARHTILS